MTAHEVTISRDFPCHRKACSKLLEPGLADVVSGNLQYLVNKLCEAATSNDCVALMLLVAKYQKSSRNGRLAAVQNWRSLADGNFRFAVRYNSGVKFSAQNYRSQQTIESIGGRVAASGPKGDIERGLLSARYGPDAGSWPQQKWAIRSPIGTSVHEPALMNNTVREPGGQLQISSPNEFLRNPSETCVIG